MDDGCHELNLGRFIEVLSTNEQRHLLEGDRELLIGSGTIHAHVQWAKFIDPYICSEDMGYSKITVIVRDERGDFYRHENVLRPTLWLPEEGMAVQRAENSACGDDLAIRCMIDSREDFTIRLNDGSEIQGRFKLTDAQFRLSFGLRSVFVVASLYVHNVMERFGPGYERISYVHPYSRFLWRHAAEFYEDDFSPESLDFTSLLAVDTGPSELRRSPLRIVDSAENTIENPVA